jgi:hypothetical protein
MYLLRQAFWKSYWIALRRSAEDTRSRLIALKISLLLLLLLAYGLLWLLPLRQSGGVWLFGSYVVMFGSAILVRLLLNRSNRRDDEMLSYSLTDSHKPTSEGMTFVSHAVRQYLEERTLILASLLARASSEIYLQHNELRPGTEVLTRQTLNAFLRETGLWDKLESMSAS